MCIHTYLYNFNIVICIYMYMCKYIFTYMLVNYSFKLRNEQFFFLKNSRFGLWRQVYETQGITRLGTG